MTKQQYADAAQALPSVWKHRVRVDEAWLSPYLRGRRLTPAAIQAVRFLADGCLFLIYRPK